MQIRPWSVAAVAAFAIVGLLFAVSALTASGTDLRSDTGALKDLVAQRAAAVDERQQQASTLQKQVRTVMREQRGSATVRAQRAIDRLSAPSGLLPLTGQGVSVSLDDADPKGNEEASPDDLVVHQQDLQAVVNAMWRGGALGVQVMDQRLINTSAVRCVGNTLILQGRVYSPPFTVTAVGDPSSIERALADDDYLRGYQAAVEFFGLGYEQNRVDTVTLPAYEGSLDFRFATAAGKDDT